MLYGYARVPYETNRLQGVASVPLEQYMFERVAAMETGVPLAMRRLPTCASIRLA